MVLVVLVTVVALDPDIINDGIDGMVNHVTTKKEILKKSESDNFFVRSESRIFAGFFTKNLKSTC